MYTRNVVYPSIAAELQREFGRRRALALSAASESEASLRALERTH